MTFKSHYLASLIGLAVALSSCGRPAVDEAGALVVARVNGSNVLSQHSAGDALERAIEEELLVQQALKERLERDPHVRRAIDAARRQVLAQAYVERAVQAAPVQSAQDIHAFYRDYPALFAHRRVYSLNQLVVAAGPERLGELRAAAQHSGSMAEMARWLKAQQLPFHAEVVSKSAEHIALDTLSQIYELRDGQIAVIAGSPGVSIVQLLRAEDMPLSEEQAGPIIAGYLGNRRRLEISRAEIGRLRAQASIEYLRKFVPMHAGLK